jgi:Ca-activated chloride channel family protein
LMRNRLAILVLTMASLSSLWGAPVLKFSSRPLLVSCSGNPCFRVEFNVVDDLGKPIPVRFSGRPKDSIRIFELDEERSVYREGVEEVYSPFLFQSVEHQGEESQDDYVMLLLDVSGSMKYDLSRAIEEPRFELARKAIKDYLRDFRQGIDHVAIAPFASTDVASRIEKATFHDSQDAVERTLAQLEPDPQGNTALYSAINIALDVLKPYLKAGHSVSLIVLTDGKNDIRSPADPGLLGNNDRQEVAARAEEYGIEVITIGFGAKGGRDFDEEALRDLASPDRYFRATSPVELNQAFDLARRGLTQRIRLTFGEVRRDKSYLGGHQGLVFRVALATERGAIEGESPPWSPGAMIPTPDTYLTESEEDAYALTGRSGITFLEKLWGRLKVFLPFLVLLLLLWFGFPRMVWPERYLRTPQMPTVGGSVRPPAVPRAPAAPRSPRMPKPRVPSVRRPQAPTPPVRRRPDPKVTISPQNRPSSRRQPERDEGSRSKRRPADATVYIPPDEDEGGGNQ